jgi:glyoxylase-like metal-dependent hydrolase (beta-lactamase superfamily II)
MSKLVEFETPYFNLYKLHEGIFAAIAKENSPTRSNMGFFDLGNHLVIVDSSMSPAAAKDLVKAAKQFTGKEKISFVINTHYHADHTYPNQIFPDTIPIIGSPETLNGFWKSMNEMKKNAPAQIEFLKKSIEKERDQAKIDGFKGNLKFLENVCDPNTNLRGPDLTISGKNTLAGTERTVEFINVGPAHTKGDLIVHFPDEKICFLGDLLFANMDPWLGHGVPEKQNEILREYQKKNIDIFVPGHGELSNNKEIALQVKYTEELIKLVKGRIKSGQQEKKILRDELSPEFQQWIGGNDRMTRNIDAMFEMYK